MFYNHNPYLRKTRWQFGNFVVCFSRRHESYWPEFVGSWMRDFKGVFSSFGKFTLDIYWSKP